MQSSGPSNMKMAKEREEEDNNHDNENKLVIPFVFLFSFFWGWKDEMICPYWTMVCGWILLAGGWVDICPAQRDSILWAGEQQIEAVTNKLPIHHG